MSKKKRRILIITISVVVLFGVLMALNIYIDKEKRVYKECSVEAGTPVSASDFVRFKKDKKSAAFQYGTSAYDVSVPGEYNVTIQLGKKTYSSKLIVTDTIAPVLSAAPKTAMYGQVIPAEDFIVTMDDQTACTVEFASEPDFERVGTQDITLTCHDLGGNVASATTQLRVIGIYPEITMEAGSKRPDASSFAFGETEAALLTPLSDIKMDEPGDYTISFSVDGIRYDSILHLEDTTPPRATGVDYEGFAGYPKTAEELVDGLTDATAVTAEFVEDPKFDEPGERDIQIRLVDAAGNEDIVTSHINLKKDDEAPVIEGTKDISIITGQAIAYKDRVTVTDNADPDITFTVDNSSVDNNTEGTYKVTYSATDKAGNTTSVEITVTVVYRPYTEDDVWELCDQILAQIINDGMSEKEKVEAIFNWVDWSVKYQGHATKISWVQGAYEGLKNRIGDCFTIASTCHALYTRAGFETFMIERYPITYAQHFWNAVKIDGVWYHCDALTKDDGTRFFMWDSAKLKTYSDSHRGYHYYDADRYDVKIP
ncbi:MAG: transglutaminase domain-containing protein [Clostridiales bacterium]|nr:transglutaminase domain-containing protein [Clostridiales bacterium]MBR5418397.1 transglutaminase domain-containing protein [Clostridiales bacterium]